MALLDTASLITDLELYNASSSTATERTVLLQHIQETEAEILAMRRWWFLLEQREHSFSAATQAYNMAADIASVDNFVNADGDLVERVDDRTWRNVYGKSAITGPAEVWNEKPRNPSSQILIVQFWPIPDATENGTFDGRLHAKALTDNSANYSKIPEEYRSILSIGAHEHMAIAEEKVQLQGGLVTKRDQLLAVMLAEDDKRGEGGP